MIALLAYIGPETIVPLTSAIAAIGGALMLFWDRVRGAVLSVFGKRRGEQPTETQA